MIIFFFFVQIFILICFLQRDFFHKSSFVWLYTAFYSNKIVKIVGLFSQLWDDLLYKLTVMCNVC